MSRDAWVCSSTAVMILYLLICFASTKVYSDRQCKWKSNAGTSYDLQKLALTQSAKEAYSIEDGDIPCTSAVEPTYGYIWNFCGDVPDSVVPEVCSSMGKKGAVLQYLDNMDNMDGDQCLILGHFDPKKNALAYALLDVNDPSKGISITYPRGERCHTGPDNSVATIDVVCANVDHYIMSANEPEPCAYHLSMKSYYGCPSECLITDRGLCNSHGHCAYDPKKKQAYCYCNEGWSGDSCDVSGSSSQSYDGYSVQVGLLATLLLLALGLTAGVMYLAYEVAEFRKQQTTSYYSSLSGGENEMVETVTFR